jgi:hypothetical protein
VAVRLHHPQRDRVFGRAPRPVPGARPDGRRSEAGRRRVPRNLHRHRARTAGDGARGEITDVKTIIGAFWLEKPYRAITAKAGNMDNRMATLGLTVTRGQYSASLGGPILQDPASGYECIAPQVDVKLNYSPVLIYVGSEFAPGTCSYKAILEHEQRHLQAYMENLARVEKVVREALNKRFEGKPLYAPSGTAMSALEHEVNGTWFPFIRDEFEKGKAKQDAIDTPEEYARLGKTCDGEIAEILLKRRKNN